MLLVELTINGVTNYISQEGIALTHFWEPKITRFDPPRYDIAHDYGGYVSPRFGSISLFPDLFDGDWPPPVSCAITIKYTATNEAAAETLFSGIAHLSQLDLGQAKYDLYGPSYTTMTADATAFNDTLTNVIATLCGGAHLNLTLNSAAARAPSPNVNFTVSGDQLDIDLVSAIAAFYTHLVYISGSTLYLVDMFGDNGTQTITEFDYLRGTMYEYLAPISLARAGGRTRTSSYPYGSELTLTAYHDTGAIVDDCLDDILTILHKPRVRMKMPFLGSLPAPGKRISWTDKSLTVDTEMYIRARSIRYDFDREEITIEGEGVIAAA